MISIAFRQIVSPLKWNKFFFGTLKPFVLPDLGEKIKDAKIKKWYVKEGDMVEEFQTLADVATDKLFTQIPSSETGKIHKIYFQEEDDCEVGQVLLEIEIESNEITGEVIGENQIALPEEVIKPEHKTIYNNHQTDTQQHNQVSSTILATPAVRNFAKTQNVKLAQVKGTGKDGRILLEDVQKHIDSLKQTKPQKVEVVKQPIQQQQTQKQQLDTPTQSKSVSNVPSTAQFNRDEKIIVKMTDFQKGMQKTMTEALKIPHFYFKDEIDVTQLMDYRAKIKKNLNINITVMTLLIKAFSLALKDFPIVNSTYDLEKPYEYTIHKNHNINVAIASQNGLVVPNIKNTQDLSITEIQDELNRLRDIAQKGQVTAKDLYGGTVTLSNIGNIGGTYTAPIILPPQVCIVGIGKMQILPRFENPSGEGLKIKASKIINISFGCDHRILDGATVANFSNKWKLYLENPELMSLYMH